MLVSVLMPVKNAENTIITAITSILCQTLKDLELIIIDDHSTDSTPKLLKNVTDSRIIVVSNKANGIAAALNTGIELAKGEYIARMDADDISMPERLQKQWQFARENPQYDVISCLVEHESMDSDGQQGYLQHIKWLNTIRTPEEHYLNRFTDAPVAHPTVFFKTSLIKRYGSYSIEAGPEDFELWLRWMEQGVQFAKVPEVLLQWTDYPNRTSRIHANYNPGKFYHLKAKYFKLWWQVNTNNREIWIWGYGKEVFRKSNHLSDIGIEVAGYIDLRARPDATRVVSAYTEISKNADKYYLIYIGDRSGKLKIVEYLSAQQMRLGKDYLIMS